MEGGRRRGTEGKVKEEEGGREGEEEGGREGEGGRRWGGGAQKLILKYTYGVGDSVCLHLLTMLSNLL